MLRYVLALSVAGLLTAGMLASVACVRRQVASWQARGVALSRGEALLAQAAGFVGSYWYVIAAVIVVICVVAAAAWEPSEE